LGLVMACTGRRREGLALEQRVLAWFEQQRDRYQAGAARWYAAMILALDGDLERAEREGREALALITMRHGPGVQATIAQTLLGRGRTAEALECAIQANKSVAERAVIEGEGLIRLVYAEALHAAGRREDAVAAIRTARDRLLARAERIVRPDWRK